MSTIFIIDDDKALCRSLQIQLEEQGHEVKFANNGGKGLTMLNQCAPNLLLLDLHLPDINGIELLQNLQKSHSGIPIVMITGNQDMTATIEAMRSGAFDYIRKPFELDDILLLIEKIEQFSKRGLLKIADAAELERSLEKPFEIIGAGKSIIEVIKLIGLLSISQVTVLITGESGTGKELVVRALHKAGSADKPFVAINCSAVVPSLFESELFGHEKGSFTGAEASRIGKLELAGEGTVFLDEIGDMPMDLQAKVLRVLQEREFERVGGAKSIPLRARVVAATNRDLSAMVKAGKFREDLYFRLVVSLIALPPLRERRGDIRLLIKYLMDHINRELHCNVGGIEEEALRLLESYDWPGNIRELENVLTRAIVLTRGPFLTVNDFTFSFDKVTKKPANHSKIFPLHEVEKGHIEKALIATGWNITQTARVLQVSPTTLRKKINDYKLKNSK